MKRLLLGLALVGSPLFAQQATVVLPPGITSLTGGVTATGPGAAAATVVTNANLTGDVTSVGNASTLANIPAIAGTNLTGTAASLTAGNATKLTTGRTIALTGGVSYTSPSFDGSGNITAAATVNTNANLTGPITSTGNATAVAAQTGTGSTFVMSASPTFTGSPVLSTASATSVALPTTSPLNSATSTSTVLSFYDEGTWTPTDASGAALSFTISAANCVYTRVGRLVIATYQIVYPVTASGSDNVIGGLPYTQKNTTNGVFSGSVGYTDLATAITMAGIQNTTTFQFRTLASGIAETNVQLSAKTIRGTFIYFI